MKFGRIPKPEHFTLAVRTPFPPGEVLQSLFGSLRPPEEMEPCGPTPKAIDALLSTLGPNDIAVFEVDWGGRETRDLVHLLADLRPGNQAWSNSPYVYFAPRQAERPSPESDSPARAT